MILRDRKNQGGGDLIIYVRNGISFKGRNDLESDSIEIIWLELQFSNKSIVLGLLYRPPNADSNSNLNWLTQMEGMLLAAYSENKPVVLTGDLNIDLWKHNSNPLRTNWQSLYENFELTQIIDKPTRVTENTATLIDHIYCSADLPVLHHSVIKYSMSDNFPVPASFDLKSPRHNINRHISITYRKFDALNYMDFASDLLSASWDKIDFEVHSIDECIDEF